MIEVFSGPPGAGKTYTVVYRAVRAMKKGRPVFSNFPICYKGLSSYVLKKNYLSDFLFPENSLVIIDECQIWYSSRDWKRLKSEELLLFTAHRHLGLDLLVTVQHPARIDTVLREITSVFWWVRNYPFFFYCVGYLDYNLLGTIVSQKKEELAIWRKSVIPKFRYVYESYDTCYRKQEFSCRQEIEYKTWSWQKK